MEAMYHVLYPFQHFTYLNNVLAKAEKRSSITKQMLGVLS